MVKAVLGTRIRERRRQIGLTQVEVARRAGISASYLNLIERNRRGIGGALLQRIAQELGIRSEDLDGVAEQRLHDELLEATTQPQFASFGLDSDGAQDLIGRLPAWARAFTSLMRSERRASELARTLSDRLSHDPFLGETVHQMLTRIAAVRSAAEILSEVRDITPDQRARFDRIIHTESQALSTVGEALAGYFDKVDEPEVALTPQDEVEALFDRSHNAFAAIEETVAADNPDQNTDPDQDADQAADGESRLKQAIEAIASSDANLQTASARARARLALEEYARLAQRLPMEALIERARALAFDVHLLGGAFGAGVADICKRLSALPRDAGLPVFGYLCANASGTILELRAHPALPIPRHAGACPLWALFRAQQTPDQVIRQFVVLPSGRKFVFVAIAQAHAPGGYAAPRHFRTEMLVISEADAAQTVYAPHATEAPETVGTACRICPHTECLHRIADPFAT